MTVEELQTRPEFVTLGQQQKEFVTAYCTNGADKIAAAERAYAVNDKKSAEATANRNLRHPVIRRLINDFYGRTDETGTKSEILHIAWKKVQGGQLDAKELLSYLTFISKLKGFEADKPAPPEDEPPAEDLTEIESLLKGNQ